jgi:hypothetical protein
MSSTNININDLISSAEESKQKIFDALNSKLAEAAGESMGCRVDDLLGSTMPTFLSAWVSLLTVLFIQSLDNFAKAYVKLQKMLFDYLERKGLLKWYHRYTAARARVAAARAKVKSIKNKVDDTQNKLENGSATLTSVQDFVDEDEDIISRVKAKATERVDEEKDKALEATDITDEDISKLKERLKAKAMKQLATAKATATAFKVTNLTITIVTFILAVWTASSWKVRRETPIVKPLASPMCTCDLIQKIRSTLCSPVVPSLCVLQPRVSEANTALLKNASAGLGETTPSFITDMTRAPSAPPVAEGEASQRLAAFSDIAAATSVCIGAKIYDRETKMLLGLGTRFGGEASNLTEYLAAKNKFSPSAPPPSPEPPPPKSPPPPPPADNKPSAPPYSLTLPEVTMETASRDGFARIIFVGMILRAPLSSKLSVAWMLLIASMGPLVREQMASRKKYQEKKTYKRLASMVIAQLACGVLVPVIVAAAAFVLVVMMLSLIAALWQINLFGIWFTLIMVLLVKEPVTILYVRLGIEDTEVDYKGLERKSTRWLIWMSEGPDFKYYFVGGLQVASVILQFFVLNQAFASLEFEAGRDRFNLFLEDYGGLTARLYSDFFTLSAYRPDYSLGSFDFLFNWRLPAIGMPDLDFDIVLTQIAQLTYMVGIASLVVEGVLDLLLTLLA